MSQQPPSVPSPYGQHPSNPGPAGNYTPRPAGMYEVSRPAGGGRNTVGTAALVVTVVMVVVQVVGQYMFQHLSFNASVTELTTYSSWSGGVVALLGLVALVLGIIGVSKRDQSKVAAAIGLGVGGHVVLLTLTQLVLALLLQF